MAKGAQGRAVVEGTAGTSAGRGGEGHKKNITQMAEWGDVRGHHRRGRGRVNCRVTRKASRSQGGCITGAGWNAMDGEMGTDRK